MFEDKGDPKLTGVEIQLLRQVVIACREFFENPDNKAARFKATQAIETLNGYDPEVIEAVAKETDSPYLPKLVVHREKGYREDYGDDRVCRCGHPYHRHFDGYEDNAAVGCKYCACFIFREDPEATRIDREARANRAAEEGKE
jgi:hypothetical protein